MSCITLALTGSLQVQGSSGDPGLTYQLQIGDGRKSADTSIGQQAYEFSSPASFLALAFPSGLSGTFVYMRNKGTEDIDVRITHATQGAVVYPLRAKGMLLLEPSEDELISALEVQGSSKIEWFVSGELP